MGFAVFPMHGGSGLTARYPCPRQKKPIPFRFPGLRKHRESCISIGSFFLSSTDPLCWALCLWGRVHSVKKEVITIDEKLTIGTPEAALASCVNLFSRLFNVPEDYARYYLDMYYQLRLQYERGDEPEPPKKTKKPRPAYETRRTMNDPEKLPEAAPETEREEKFQEVLASVNAGSAPRKTAGDHAIGNHHAADAAAEKRRIRDRLLQMRQNGVSTPQIIKGGNGCITEDQIRLIVDAKPVPIAVYRVLDGVLETLAAAPPEN